MAYFLERLSPWTMVENGDDLVRDISNLGNQLKMNALLIASHVDHIRMWDIALLSYEPD